jgi:hypothetical protein
MATDPAVASRLAAFGDAAIGQVDFAAAAAGAALAVTAGGLWQRLRESRARGPRKSGPKAALITKFFQIGATPR